MARAYHDEVTILNMKRFFRMSGSSQQPLGAAEIVQFVLPVVENIIQALLTQHAADICFHDGQILLGEVLRKLQCEDAMWCFVEDWLQTASFAELIAHPYMARHRALSAMQKVVWDPEVSFQRSTSQQHVDMSQSFHTNFTATSPISGKAFNESRATDYPSDDNTSNTDRSEDMSSNCHMRPDRYDPFQVLREAEVDANGQWGVLLSVCWTVRTLYQIGFDMGSTGFDLKTLAVHLLLSVLRFGTAVLVDSDTDIDVPTTSLSSGDSPQRRQTNISSISRIYSSLVRAVSQAHLFYRVLLCVDMLHDIVVLALPSDASDSSSLHVVFFNFVHIFQDIISAHNIAALRQSPDSSADISVIQKCQDLVVMVITKLFRPVAQVDISSDVKSGLRHTVSDYMAIMQAYRETTRAVLGKTPAETKPNPLDVFTVDTTAYNALYGPGKSYMLEVSCDCL